jgi:CubicO group peptidase (beta-lactamase class C family)
VISCLAFVEDKKMPTTSRRPVVAVALLAMFAAASVLAAPPSGFDAQVRAAMDSRDVPGMAVAIVEDGKATLARGYGVRKAVTAAALAILVDEGKLRWDDKVIDHLPDFRMYDPWVTREMTVRDLLVHRSGLGLGAGDLLFVPRTSRNRADVVKALRHIAPATSFRSGYAYDNILYVVAGELVATISGQSWEDFVRDRVFKAAEMKSSVSDENDRFANPNRAQPHARIGGRVRGVGAQQVLPEREGLGQVAAPAGGLSSSANDLARWLQIQLAQGALPEGDKRLYSEAAAREMWTPQVLTPIRPLPAPITEITPR